MHTEQQQFPLRYFNISECKSYSNFWVWDLALSCDNATSLENCECLSASILYQYGDLECPGSQDSSACPTNCPVCNTCMKLLGCPAESAKAQQSLPNGAQQGMARSIPIALGVAAAVFTLGALAYALNSKPRVNENLQSALMDAPPMDPML